MDHDHFEGALDRFAQFFIAPLFNEESTRKEVNAVASEHGKNSLSDDWREQSILQVRDNETETPSPPRLVCPVFLMILLFLCACVVSAAVRPRVSVPQVSHGVLSDTRVPGRQAI